MDVVAEILIVAGTVFTLIGGLGVIKFEDMLSRMHAASKAPTLGLILVALGAAIELGTAHATAALLLVVVLQLLTTPVGSHVLGRSSYRRLGVVVDDANTLDDS